MKHNHSLHSCSLPTSLPLSPYKYPSCSKIHLVRTYLGSTTCSLVSPPGHHPRGTQPPQGMQARGTVLSPHTHTPAPTARGWRTPTARPIGEQSGEGQRLTSDAPHTMVEGTSPRDARPPPPQRATPARKGARCGAGAGSPRPHQPHPGHTGRGTLATRSRGRAAKRGTAPNTIRPSQ